MPVSRPTVETHATAAGQASAQAAIDTLCDYIDATNAAVVASATNITTLTTMDATIQARIDSEINRLKHALRRAGVQF